MQRGRPIGLRELAAELVRLKGRYYRGSRRGQDNPGGQEFYQDDPDRYDGAGLDPAEAGLVEGLARPGGNVTGFSTAFRAYSVASGWSCSKKQFPNLLVSQYSTILCNSR